MSEIVNQSRGFSVVLSRPEQRDPMALAKALAAVRRTPVQDQLMVAKSCWGIVAEQMAEPEARMLSELLKASGLDCVVVPATSLVSLPEALPLKGVEPGWADNLVLLAAAGFTVTSTTTRVEHQGPTTGQKILSAGIMMTTGLPIRIGPKQKEIKKEQTQSDLVFYADLLYRNPPQRRRVDARHFDYSFLKERMLYHGMGNFKLLLAATIELAPQAWRNHGAKVLLEGLPVPTMGYTSLADLERETRWLLTLLNLQK